MIRLALLTLAFSAMVPLAAAQNRTVTGPYPSVAPHVSDADLSQRALREGDEVIRIGFPHEQVGRLQNDVVRNAWGGNVVVMPRGTPVYRTRFRYRVMTSGTAADVVIHDLSWPMWCGPTTTEAERGVVGHCVVLRRGRAEVARIVGGSLHSSDLSAFSPATLPEIANDPRAARELQPAALVYRVRQVRSSHVVVQLDLEENGRTETWDRLRAPRNRDGVATLDIDGRALRIQGDSRAVRFSFEDADELQRVAEVSR